jgi:6-phospho-beta-glucosidase
MPDVVKLAVLGGSGVATPELVDVLARPEEQERPPVHIALIGRSEDKLQAVGAMCQRLAERVTPTITISTHTDPRQGLEGADYILNQIRVGGYPERAFDETFPREFGIPGEETFGPGGMNMALRTIPVVIELCRIAEEVAPGALMINLTNPSSMVQYAINYATGVKVVSICDLPMMAKQMIADLLEIPVSELVVRYTGMNHFGWVTGVRWQGQDMLTRVLDSLITSRDLPVEAEIIRALGVLPTSYFKYYYHANRALSAQQNKRARAEELLELEAEILAAYQSGNLAEKPASLVRRNAVWYEHMIMPLLLAHVRNTGEVLELQVTNDQALPFLPPQAIIEVPTVVQRSGFLPLAYDNGLPPDLEALLLTNATFEMLWAEAVVEKSYSKALRAMLANHLVTNYDQARGLLEKIWPK